MNRRVERQRGLLAIVHFDDWDLPNFELICDLNDYAWHDYAGASVIVSNCTPELFLARSAEVFPSSLYTAVSVAGHRRSSSTASL